MREICCCDKPGMDAIGDEALLAWLFSGEALFGGRSRTACLRFCQSHRDLVLSCLPLVLASLARRCGFDMMFDIVATFGGRRIYLPMESSRFGKQVGLFIPRADYDHWRLQADVNGQIEVPSAWGVYLALRRAGITFALTRAWPREIMQSTFGMSRRQLRFYSSDIPVTSSARRPSHSTVKRSPT